MKLHINPINGALYTEYPVLTMTEVFSEFNKTKLQCEKIFDLKNNVLKERIKKLQEKFIRSMTKKEREEFEELVGLDKNECVPLENLSRVNWYRGE